MLQDTVAALNDLAQVLGVGTLKIGETGLQLIRHGAGEARLVGALRVDGIVRGLGGIFGGTYTTTQRDAIASGFRPYGLIIVNTTTNRAEINLGSDATPIWKALGADEAADLIFTGAASSIEFTGQTPNNNIITAMRTGDSVARIAVREDGRMEWGAGTGTRDVNLYRSAADVLKTDDFFSAAGIAVPSVTDIASITGEIDGQLARVRFGSNEFWNMATLWYETNFPGGAKWVGQEYSLGYSTESLVGDNETREHFYVPLPWEVVWAAGLTWQVRLRAEQWMTGGSGDMGPELWAASGEINTGLNANDTIFWNPASPITGQNTARALRDSGWQTVPALTSTHDLISVFVTSKSSGGGNDTHFEGALFARLISR